MKIIILGILFMPTILFGQIINTTEKRSSNNIYSNAIGHYITYKLKNDKIKLDTILLENSGIIVDSILLKINGTVVQIINKSEIEKLIISKPYFDMYKISPLAFDNGLFYISIVRFVLNKDDDEPIFENTGGCNVIYEFSAELKRFKFKSVNCWSI